MREFTILDVAQRSPEWQQARAGRLTASRAADMVATIRTGEAAARRDLRLQLAVERLTCRPTENPYINAEMQRGIDCEPLARAAYEAITGAFVHETGFLQHTTILAGCSLDGHVGDFETVVSLKCPKSATHLTYLRNGQMPPAYVPQMLHELWITGAAYYDFFSWDDRMPEGLQTFYIRVHRSPSAVEEYADKALAFLAEVEAEVAAVSALRRSA